MQVNAGAVAVGPDRLIVLLRRLGVVAGFLIGFAIITVIAAREASADDGGLLGDITAPVVKPVVQVAAPVVEPVAEAAAPLVEPVAEVAQPVARVVEPVVAEVATVTDPVVEPLVAAVAPTVKPVIAPVVDVIDPLVEAVAPVVRPVAAPIVGAVEPVLAPVEAAGVEQVVDRIGPAEAATPAPRSPDRAAPPRTPVSIPESTVQIPRRGTVSESWATAPSRVPAAEDTATVIARPGGDGGQLPGPAGQAPAVAGTSTTSIGSGGTHHADNAVSAVAPGRAHENKAGRAPPDANAASTRVGYDLRNHPS